MHPDPSTLILAAALLGAALGFMAACVICSRRIRRANLEGFKEAVRLYADRDQ